MKNCTFSFCPNFFWESLYMWGSQEKILGHKVNEKIFRVDPGRKKSKKVNKILFPFPFPVIPKNGGLWFPFPNFGNGFFHSLPVPEFWEWIFFIPFPFPNFGNGIFSFPSHSRNLGMDFFIPFPFPNFGNGLFQFPFPSRILKSHSRSPLWWVVWKAINSWGWEYHRAGSASFFSKFSHLAVLTLCGGMLLSQRHLGLKIPLT